MPRVAVPTTVSDADGTVLPAETAGDATNNMVVQNTGKTKVHVRNSGATPRVLTILIYRTVAGQPVTSITKTIPAGETHVFGPYPVNDFGTQLLLNPAHAELMFRAID